MIKGYINHIALVVAFLVTAGNATYAQSAFRKVLNGEIKSGFEPAREVNVRHKEAATIVKFDNSEVLRLILDYAWKGGDLDWYRHGKPGFAQRIQFREKSSKRMKAGRDYWYTASFFIPKSALRVTHHTLSFMDFKHHIGKYGSVPTVSLTIQPNGHLHIIEALSSNWNCGTYRNINGGKTAACDRVEAVGLLGTQSQVSGRWIKMVAHMRWENNPSGFFRIWLNNKPILAFSGNTLQGSTQVEYKFGLYRHHIERNPGRIEVLYTNVARAKTCAMLPGVDCSSLRAPRNGLQNIRGRERWVSKEYSRRKQ